MPKIISPKLSYLIRDLYNLDFTLTNISRITNVSRSTINKILKSMGFPKCKLCGKKMPDKNLSRYYCESCRKIMQKIYSKRYYNKMRRINFQTIYLEWYKYNNDIISTHGDLFNKNLQTIGTGNLGPHREKSIEKEIEAVENELGFLLEKRNLKRFKNEILS